MHRSRLTSIVAVAVGSALLMTGCAAAGTRPEPTPSSSSRVAAPDASTLATRQGAWYPADGTIRLGTASAEHTVDIWFDLRCPYCRRLDENARAAITQWTDSGSITLRLHPLSFLDKASAGSAYSSRAATALIETARTDPAAVLPTTAALFDAQPEEGTTGLDDDALTAIAADHGVDVTDALRDRPFDALLAYENELAFTGPAPITGTPTVRVDGDTVQGDLYGAAFLDTMRSRLAA